MIINTVEKKYDLTNNFHNYKVTYKNSNVEKFVPLDDQTQITKQYKNG